tara:strand:- start:195 stop:470 length:276 start_codon:yes stop_codon:yes gene_type:complete
VCDIFPFENKYLFGNIKRGMKKAISSPNYLSFCNNKSVNIQCVDCKYEKHCKGACDRGSQVNNKEYVGYYCNTYKKIFQYTEDRLKNYLIR